MTSPLLHEIRRKMFHVWGASFAVLYAFAGRGITLKILGGMFLAAAVTEAVRLRVPRLNDVFLRLFGGIHREEEIHRPSGILWTLLGCFLTVFFVPYPDIVQASLLYMVLGDGVASIVGRGWGHIRIGSKSLEGSLACFLVCWCVGSVCLTPHFGSVEIVWGALAATLLELLPLPLNDNLWIPLVSGIFLTLLRSAFFG